MPKYRATVLFIAVALVAAACSIENGPDTTEDKDTTTTHEPPLGGFPWVELQASPTDDIPPALDGLTFINDNTHQNPCPGCGQVRSENEIVSTGFGNNQCDHPVLYIEEQLISIEDPGTGLDITPILMYPDGEESFTLEDGLRLWDLDGTDPIDFLVDNPDFEGWPNFVYLTAPAWKFSPADAKVSVNDQTMLIDGTPFEGGQVAVIDEFSGNTGHGEFVSHIVEQLTGLTPGMYDVQFNHVDEAGNDLGAWPHPSDTPSVFAALSAAFTAQPDAVINMSMGTYGCLVGDVEIHPVPMGGDIVAAAGNDAHQDSPVFYPAGFPDVTGVGALGWSPEHETWYAADFSNIVGADVWAPGVAVVANDGDNIVAWSGTSFAAPHYAACFAVAKC